MKVDILAIGAHPDDVELGCGGTLALHTAKGMKAVIVDLTRGELGTRGTAATRLEEARKAASILKLSGRMNLGLKDGFIQADDKSKLRVIKSIRLFQPEILLINAASDRHPDHGNAATLCSEAAFLSGLIKIKTSYNKKAQKAWRPKAVYHYIQDKHIEPDFVVDISDFMPQRMKAIEAYASQFVSASSKEPETYISSQAFMDSLTARPMEFGRRSGVKYAEGFITQRYPGVKLLTDLF